MIDTLWVFCIIFALLQVIVVVLLLTGHGDNFLVMEKKRDQYHLDRVRILTIILSISAIIFCIVFPLMMTIGNREGVLMVAGVILAVVVIVAILINTWAKKKYEY